VSEFLAERAAEALEVTLADETVRRRLCGERSLDLVHVDRHLERAETQLHCPGVGQGATYRRAGTPNDRADEDHGDLLPAQPVVDERRVGLGDERPRGLVLPVARD
jgi:hypothetical protein